MVALCGRPAPHTGAVTKNRHEPGTRWWDFIGYRRRYVSDRVWFGAGFIAASVGSLDAAPGWWKILDLAGLVVGTALAWSGIRHWLRRRDRANTGNTEPR
jgi:hypothetical protein